MVVGSSPTVGVFKERVVQLRLRGREVIYHMQEDACYAKLVLDNVHCWVAAGELQSACMAMLWDILQRFAELQVEAEPGPHSPRIAG